MVVSRLDFQHDNNAVEREPLCRENKDKWQVMRLTCEQIAQYDWPSILSHIMLA